MPKKPRQRTLEATLGQRPVRKVVKKASSAKGPFSSSATQPPSSSLAKSTRSSSSRTPGSSRSRPVVLSDDESTSADEISGLVNDDDGSEDPGPRRSRRSKAWKNVVEHVDEDELSTSARPSVDPHIDEVDEDEDDIPLKPKRSRKATPVKPVNRAGLSDGDEDDEDDVAPISAKRSALRRQRSSLPKLPAGDEDEDDDEDDLPLLPSTARKLSGKRKLVLNSDDEEGNSAGSTPSKRRRLFNRTQKDQTEESDLDVSEVEITNNQPSSSSRRKGPRTAKEKARELLRRKRAGENIDEEDLTASENDEEAKGVYDTDSDDGYQALKEFEDDEEGVLELEKPKKTSKKSKKAKAPRQRDDSDLGSGGEEEEDLDDFIVEDDDAPIGAPDDLMAQIPLEFTSHSHKPLHEHFKNAVEWLVQMKINPGFEEKNHDLYRLAWRRLNDEVEGLANSKFQSSAWKQDFTLALRARPCMDSSEITYGDVLELENCGACGRSGHPAKWIVRFSGTPYSKHWGRSFMEQVEVDSDDEDEENGVNVDEDGSSIPPETTSWHVGSTCNANATMAHDLMHWKHALLEWVESTLNAEGRLQPRNLDKLRKMTPKKRYKMVDEIVQNWDDTGVLRALYNDFNGVLENARHQSTAGRRKGLLHR